MIGEEENDPLAVEQAANAESASGYNVGGSTMPSYAPAAMSDLEVIKSMGMDPQSIMSPTFSAEAAAYRNAVGRQRAIDAKRQADAAKDMEKRSDPFFRAQNIYGKIGNLAAARTIAKTTGPALFQLGEQIDLGPDQMFAIRPVGDVDVPKQDGTSMKMPAWQLLHANGVSVVPYLGGDEEAKGFRSMAAKAGELMNTLSEIEKLYENGDLKSMRGTETYRRLVQLEAGLSTIVQAIKTGSKSMAGVSDKEMEAIQASLPQSGTKLLESTGSGLINVRNTRAQVLGILTRTARMNGIELVQLRPQSAATRGRATTPSGVTIPSNGKQSGSSTSGQPR